jgi:hypothetical protein
MEEGIRTEEIKKKTTKGKIFVIPIEREMNQHNKI